MTTGNELMGTNMTDRSEMTGNQGTRVSLPTPSPPALAHQRSQSAAIITPTVSSPLPPSAVPILTPLLTTSPAQDKAAAERERQRQREQERRRREAVSFLIFVTHHLYIFLIYVYTKIAIRSTDGWTNRHEHAE